MTTLQTENLKVLAIDPGIMTGYCQGMIKEGRLHFTIFQQMDEVDDLWRRLRELKPRFIVCESFEFRGGHHRAATKVEYFPIQLIGVARLYAEIADHKCACLLQTPAQGKGYFTNNVLKAQQVLKRGMATKFPHGLDATRHMLQWFIFGPGYQYNTTDQKPSFVYHESWRYIDA